MTKLTELAKEHLPNHETTGPISFNSSLKETIVAEYDRRMNELRPIIMVVENPIDLSDEGFRVSVFPKVSFGLRKAGELVAYLTYHYGVAVNARKRAYAVAFLEEFNEYAEKREIKSTDKAREFYVHINKTVQAAVSAEATLEAYLENAKTVKQEFIMALSTIKAMVYGLKDSEQLSSSAS